jgi:hypothetical protein
MHPFSPDASALLQCVPQDASPHSRHFGPAPCNASLRMHPSVPTRSTRWVPYTCMSKYASPCPTLTVETLELLGYESRHEIFRVCIPCHANPRCHFLPSMHPHQRSSRDVTRTVHMRPYNPSIPPSTILSMHPHAFLVLDMLGIQQEYSATSASF